ncbi:MAG: HAD-IB family hydrolase [Actinobacteria bacterium]|nr:HAD-IB family hydrolase [Actinomycetota bacterium]
MEDSIQTKANQTKTVQTKTVQAAFFDLDKTVIAKPSLAAFGKPLKKEGLISKTVLLRGLYAQLIYLHLGASEERLNRMRESLLVLIKGWEREKVINIVRETLEQVIEPIIFREALDLIEEHKANGDKVFLISAAPEEIVKPLAGYLGVDNWVASRAKVDNQGYYTGEMEFYAYGPFKAQAINQLALDKNIDLSSSFAYSDSYTDLPMMEMVGHPIVVNPDRVLAKTAKERGWEIRYFVHPVRLRDKMPVSKKSAMVAGVATASAVVGVAVTVMLKKRARRLLG